MTIERLGPPMEQIDTYADGPVLCRVDHDSEGSQRLYFTHTCVGGERYEERLPLWNGGWVVVTESPLTVSPSIDCKGCGTHGFWTAGVWRPV